MDSKTLRRINTTFSHINPDAEASQLSSILLEGCFAQAKKVCTYIPPFPFSPFYHSIPPNSAPFSSFHHFIISSFHHFIISSFHHFIISSFHPILPSSHPPILPSSHPPILPSSHPPILTSSHPHILTSSHPQHLCSHLFTHVV
jgi:hypothetical protein